MAKKVSKKPAAQSTKSNAVRVKNAGEVFARVNHFIAHNLHDRYKVNFSSKTKRSVVAYGPWIATLILLVIAPELLVLAKTGEFITPGGFIEEMLFSKESWVLLIVLFVNCLSLSGALGELFNKALRGWNRVYVALLINLFYSLWELGTHIEQPAAPLLAGIGIALLLFSLFDIKEYYTA